MKTEIAVWIGLRYVFFFTTVLNLFACDDMHTDDSITREPLFAGLQGSWRQQGYGNVLEIGEHTYMFYQVTAISCIRDHGGSLQELVKTLAGLHVNDSKDQFALEYRDNLTRYYFDKHTTLPERCRQDDAMYTDDPEVNFEIFWRTLNEEYAFFAVRNVDWIAQYATYRPRVNADTNDEELFGIFKQMLAPLNDGHTGLFSVALGEYVSANVALFERWRSSFAAQTMLRDFAAYIDRRILSVQTIIAGYLRTLPKSAANGKLIWGILDEDKGYLAVNAMAGFIHDDDISVAGLDVLDEALDRALMDLANQNTLVLDLRMNSGGMDQAAVRIANRFIAQDRPGFAKQARMGNGYTPLQIIHLHSVSRPRFLGRLLILTSSITASAAENLLLALLTRPDTTLVGEPTAGIFSDVLGRKLPNGWFFSLSNEVFQTVEGRVYESIGFIPDILLSDMFSDTELAQGTDAGLEQVLRM